MGRLTVTQITDPKKNNAFFIPASVAAFDFVSPVITVTARFNQNPGEGNMFKKIGYALLTVALLGAAPLAIANTHWDGFTALTAEGLPEGGQTWADVEASNGYWNGACADINKNMGTNIPCTIDHASFQAFYANELKQPQKMDRVNSHPGQLCGASGLYFFSTMSVITQDDFQFCRKDAACLKDFTSRVHAINCVIKATNAEPSLTLENGTLTFVITRKPDGEVPNGDGWVKHEAFKLFPLYKALAAQHNSI